LSLLQLVVIKKVLKLCLEITFSPRDVGSAVLPSTPRAWVIKRNSKGAIVYGSHNLLFVIDAFTFKRVQTIDLHTTAVDHVCWSPPFSIIEQTRADDHRIASSDISGQIVISEPITASKRCQFSHAASNVINMKWFVWKDMSRDFLLSLHSGDCLMLWNTDNGEKMWSMTYTTPLFDLAVDPFNTRHAAFSSVGCSVMLCSDVNVNNTPSNSTRTVSLCDDQVKSASSIQNLVYHKAYRNILFAAAHGQVHCLHTELFAVLFTTNLEPNLISLLSCSTRDAVFTVQANGSVALRVGVFTTNDERADAQLSLEKVAFGEIQRQGAQQRAVGAALCPVTQNAVAVLFSSGRVVLWQTSDKSCVLDYRGSYIEDNLLFSKSLDTTPIGALSIHQTGFLDALSSGVSCLRMRPIDDLQVLNTSFAGTTTHLVAVGSQSGTLHLVDVFTCDVVREFSVQSSPIKCLEWGGTYIVLTAGYNHSLSTAQVVRNDIFATDIRTGKLKRRIRPEADESPVTLLRVSFYQCYLALAFQREPLEIWDLKGLRLLRRMSKTCPLIVDMAWSCKHHGIKTTEDGGLSIYRENLVVLDSDNRLYHVVVKGLHVKDGKEVNTQWKSGGWSIRTMAWKDDMLAMGDAEGRVVIWDLGRRQSRHVRASRFPVVRMTFSRLAGDHTLAVLHQRELTLWDTEALTRQHQVTLDSSRCALDMDLCGVSPLLLTNDNVLRYAPGASKNSPMLEKGQIFESTASFATERELRVTCAACGAANVEESRLVERAVVTGGKAKVAVVDLLLLVLVLLNYCVLNVSYGQNILSYGVELLFLVKAGGDACKYLQSQRQWNKSVVYAKMGLEDTEDVLSKWITHLSLLQNCGRLRLKSSRLSWLIMFFAGDSMIEWARE
uniref:WD_REPEATS_REGION domain-containing protein n=1 Tax=Heligmosomoides polygyrus TaxID=6339 RepID=A0A183FHF4_HELPZ